MKRIVKGLWFGRREERRWQSGGLKSLALLGNQ
jgi:hypothetical protein